MFIIANRVEVQLLLYHKSTNILICASVRTEAQNLQPEGPLFIGVLLIVIVIIRHLGIEKSES